MSAQAEELLRDSTIVEWVDEREPLLVHIAVSFAGRLLADLGARVCRVAPENDPLLGVKSAASETVGSNSLLAHFLDRKKERVDAAQAAALVAGDEEPDLWLRGERDVARFDGNVARVRVGASVSGSDIPVSELGIQGLVGLTDLFGEPGEQPLMMGGHQTSYATGYAVFCAAMAALAKKHFLRRNDEAQVNAVDTLAWVNWKGVAAGTLGFPVRRGGKGAEAPVLKCANGYFALLHMPNNWPDILSEVDDPRLQDEQFDGPGRRAKNALALNEILASWAADKRWQYLYEFCQRCAIPGGPVLRGGDLIKDPLYEHRSFIESVPYPSDSETTHIQVPGLPLKIEGTATASASSAKARVAQYSQSTPRDLPLSGKLVLDLGIFTAGSVTSTLLADLGATVIKVESESYSDPFRLWPGIKGDSPLFVFNNRNKLGLNLDLKTDEGRALFMQLVAQADVVVENFRRGVLDRLGINYDALRATNPRIVLASISGQGASGPGSGHVSFGTTLEAIGGVAALTGYSDRGCYVSGRNLNYPDQIVCLYGAGAVIAALLNVEATGNGLHIDVSQREVTTLAVGEAVAAASLFGNPTDFPGNSDVNAFVQDIYPVSDGWLCVTIDQDDRLEAVASYLGKPTEGVADALPGWLEGKDSQQAISELRPLGVAVFKANTGADAAQEDAILSGAAFATTAAGDMVKGFPFQFAATPLSIYEESPAMGEHTAHILGTLEEAQ